MYTTLREKCLYSEFFWSIFSYIRTEYGEIFSPNLEKYWPEKLGKRSVQKNKDKSFKFKIQMKFTYIWIL